MDENYKDPRIISRLNADFVPMKVDTDKMPDVNFRYNQGGWPSLVFLDGDAELMRLAGVSGKKLYEKQGLKVCHFFHKAFRAPNGSLADRLPLPDDVGRLKVRYQLAGENAEAALLFFDVAKHTGEKQYRETAKQILDVFSGIYKQDIRATGGYAKAVAIFFETI